MSQFNYDTTGIASSSTDALNTIPVITGDTPDIVTTPEVVGAADLVAHRVVGRDSSGLIIDADPSTAPAIGVTVYAGVIGGPVSVYRAACLNPDVLSWPSGYSTALLKKKAFEATGTQIFTRQPPAY